MELTNMLRYQKIDIGVYKLEKEFNQCKEREILLHCKKSFDAKKETLTKLSKELDATLALISQLSEKVKELLTESSWENFDIDSYTEEEVLVEDAKKFGSYEEKLNEIMTELTKALKREEEIALENKRLNEAMEELNNKYKIASAQLEKKRTEMVEKIKPTLVQLKAIMPEIDKDIYAKYMELRKSKKMPALVLYNEGCCGGCGMNIEIEVAKKLINSGDIAECPHCARMVYKA